ncbi:hypothetical protein JVT61DRAFT_14019 [Boletus reticuloceps]|uniref:Uncharacterized protein n=1 Tax=Boletus reticuloceps TaxID=495285 RepID=A0A8I2YUC2_9AGAM|nr:hypothetical protein JVT61DRAFT_14019 [Boletus reticuloceps]
MSGLGLGVTIPFKWTKDLLDGVNSFDVELTRLQEDGLILLAKDVPTTYTTLNILLQDVPAGDDYFIVCFNSSNSILFAVHNHHFFVGSVEPQTRSVGSDSDGFWTSQSSQWICLHPRSIRKFGQ